MGGAGEVRFKLCFFSKKTGGCFVCDLVAI